MSTTDTSTASDPEISIVIPVYNEEKNITETIRRIQAFMLLKKTSWECLIVNDGSKDRTERVAREAIKSQSDARFKFLSNSENHGKGFVVRQGVLASTGRFILVTDADLSSPIKEIDKLINALNEGYDVAIGSRALRSPGADVQQSLKRRLASRLFNAVVRLLILRGFLDTQCGFKCFKKDAAHELFKAQKLDGFSFDVEVLYLAQRRGLKIKEVPVMWRQSKETRVRLFRDSISMVKDLLLLRGGQGVKNEIRD
ncbi:MAG: hypothetical protein AUJ72_01985 [Candidatus Omnitrophica bacterium CG1_02_46_14]|nr:MAG: hypothetical protein AUJ72_01985 [Candidatus Omnitrophica bacterium CG1_02_46_14]